jgi:hypothetical protein
MLSKEQVQHLVGHVHDALKAHPVVSIVEEYDDFIDTEDDDFIDSEAWEVALKKAIDDDPILPRYDDMIQGPGLLDTLLQYFNGEFDG